MSTLFQLHANINHLKSITYEMATLWQPNDSILLLGATASYLDWFKAYISDNNIDDESDKKIEDIAAIYLLTDDINALNDSAKLNLDISSSNPAPTKLLSDTDWVILTQQMDRVVTLTSAV